MAEHILAADFEAWQHDRIEDIDIDTVGLPFSDDFLAASFPAEVTSAALGDVSTSGLPLIRTGRLHARSYQVAAGHHRLAEFSEEQDVVKTFGIDSGEGQFIASALWADRYGNPYTGLNLKGNNFRQQRIFRSLTAPSGFIPYGLQESHSLARVLKASALMRQAGIDTEWPVRLLEPKVLQFGEDRVSQAEYRQRLVAVAALEESDPAEAAAIAKAIEDMTFYVTVRATKLPDRVMDFVLDAEDHGAAALYARLGRVFAINNMLAKDGQRKLSVHSPENVDYYFTELLPAAAGTNLAKLHEAGLAHGFPVAGNVNALGGLVDLDSVKGEPLGFGDAPITPEDIANDIGSLLSGGKIGSEGMLDLATVLHDRNIIAGSKSGIYRAMEAKFLKAYLLQRGLDPSDRQDATELVKIFGCVIGYRGWSMRTLGQQALETLNNGRPIDVEQLFCLSELQPIVASSIMRRLPELTRLAGDVTFSEYLRQQPETFNPEDSSKDGEILEYCMRNIADSVTTHISELDETLPGIKHAILAWVVAAFPTELAVPAMVILRYMAQQQLVPSIQQLPAISLGIQEKTEAYRQSLDLRPIQIEMPPNLTDFLQQVANKQRNVVWLGSLSTVYPRVGFGELAQALIVEDYDEAKFRILISDNTGEATINVDEIIRKSDSGSPKLFITDGGVNLAENEYGSAVWDVRRDGRVIANYVSFICQPNADGRVDWHIMLTDATPIVKQPRPRLGFRARWHKMIVQLVDAAMLEPLLFANKQSDKD